MRRTLLILALALALAASACARPRQGALLDGGMATDTADDSGAHVATDGSGTWIVVWTSEGFAGSDTDVLFSRSTDDGETWSTSAVLRPEMLSDGATDEGAIVGYDASGDWIAAWSSTNPYGTANAGGDADVVIARSSDGGQTWSTPLALNQSMIGDSQADAVAGLTTDDNQGWVASLDQGYLSNGTWFAHSDDGGVTWSPTTYLPNYGLEPARVVTDGSGKWVAAWHTVYPPSGSQYYEALTTVSPDGGKTWGAQPSLLPRTAPTQVGDATWPAIATDRNGHWVTAWTIDYTGVVTATSTDGVTWTGPVSVPIGGSPLNPVQNYGPRVTTGGDGVWSLSWSTYGDSKLSFGADHDILWSVSRDDGSSWTSPTPLTDEMDSDDGWDGDLSVATDGQSHWVFVWTTGGHTAGPSSVDSDIRVLPITVEY